jgi:hypothetical protein
VDKTAEPSATRGGGKGGGARVRGGGRTQNGASPFLVRHCGGTAVTVDPTADLRFIHCSEVPAPATAKSIDRRRAGYDLKTVDLLLLRGWRQSRSMLAKMVACCKLLRPAASLTKRGSEPRLHYVSIYMIKVLRKSPYYYVNANAIL